MYNAKAISPSSAPLPSWVPDDARRYLEHTEIGRPIRALAREAKCHASTVLRQVRRFETRRDDPLVDAALRDLALRFARASSRDKKESAAMPIPRQKSAKTPLSSSDLSSESGRILRRLNEEEAVLAVAEGMEMAVVVRDMADGGAARTATVPRALAEAMALKDWIFCPDPGRISRYHITAAGRAELRRQMAENENKARGLNEAATRFEGAPIAAMRPRSWNSDSPLAGLARRRDRAGQPFLSRELVSAGERLREDYELAAMGDAASQDWDRIISGDISAFGLDDPLTDTPHRRVADALVALGPDLADVVLRSCCFLEGMEAIERSMGWSARSGKIVLRIALQRLQRHYGEAQTGDALIG